MSLERFLNIRTAYGPTLSPDGRRMAFIATITGVPQVWVLDAPSAAGAWPDLLTLGGDRVMGANWSPVDDQLVFSRDVGGNENAQLFLINASGTGQRQLTHAEQAMHLFGAWSADGRTLAFAANRRDPARYDIYLYDFSTGEERLLWQNDLAGFFFPVAYAPGGQRLLLPLMRSSMDQDLYELSLPAAAGQPASLRHLTPHSGEARFLTPCYSADGRSVYCSSDLFRDHAALVRLDLDSLGLEAVVEPAREIEDVAAATSGRWLAWAENHDGRHVLRARDLVAATTMTADLPPGVVYPTPADMSASALLFGTGAAADRLLFTFSTPTRTADVWVWDLGHNHVAPVTRSSHGGLPAGILAEPDLIHYPTFDGRQIPAWYYRAGRSQEPPRPRPVVVYVHGGPEGQTQAMLYPILQYLVNHGYHVLAPNVRGSSGYGKEYLNLDNVERRLDAVADLAYAAHWLRQQRDVDGSRLAVYGGSYGGFMVLSALTHYPELWAAAVDIVGIANFVTFLERTGAYRRAVREAEYGSLAQHRALLEELSPIHQADRIRAPLFVVHGRNDPRVPLEEAEQIVAALRARQVPVELLVYDDEGHGLVKLANKLDAYPKIAAFLDRHLLGAPRAQ